MYSDKIIYLGVSRLDMEQACKELLLMEGKVITKIACSGNPDTVFIYTADDKDSPVEDWTLHFFLLK